MPPCTPSVWSSFQSDPLCGDVWPGALHVSVIMGRMLPATPGALLRLSCFDGPHLSGAVGDTCSAAQLSQWPYAAACQVRKLMDSRLRPGWSFRDLYGVKDSLAIMMEAAGLLEDALREYFELEACYLEALVEGGALGGREFGGPACSGTASQGCLWPKQPTAHEGRARPWHPFSGGHGC